MNTANAVRGPGAIFGGDEIDASIVEQVLQKFPQARSWPWPDGGIHAGCCEPCAEYVRIHSDSEPMGKPS